MSKKTNLEIANFNVIANNYLKAFQTLPKKKVIHVKLKYALEKVLKQTKPIEEAVREKIDLKQIDLCSTDSDGNIIVNDKGGYKFTPEKAKENSSFSKEVWLEEHTIKPHLVENQKEIGLALTLIFREAGLNLDLNGFVFKELTEAEEIAALELEEATEEKK